MVSGGEMKRNKPKFRVGDKVRDTHGHVTEGLVVSVEVVPFYVIRVTKAGSKYTKRGAIIDSYSEDELRQIRRKP
jgi:ribosomal protein L19